MHITQIDDKGYTFTARAITYTIFDNGNTFEIWCKKGRFTNPPRVMTRQEMRKTSKVMAGFLDVLEA